MKYLLTLSFAMIAASVSFATQPAASDTEQATETLTIASNRDFQRVEKLMNQSEAAHVKVTIAPGNYKLKDTFHINRSNVTLSGSGDVLLQLAKRVQRPVIAIGTQTEYPGDHERIHNIIVADLKIDGNKAHQKSEYDRHLPWIRNNGIDVRTVTGLQLQRVTSDRNRSGGFVISWRCRDIVAQDCSFAENYFDGVAYYDSAHVYTLNCSMKNNDGAGVSLDNSFVDSTFAGCTLDSNRDVGVFARHSSRLTFYDCAITNSGNWALFLSHDEKGHGAFDVDVVSCDIQGNRGGYRMGSVTQAQSARNSLSGTTFANNSSHGRNDLSTAGSIVEVFDENLATPNAFQHQSDSPDYERHSLYPKRVYQAILKIEEIDRS